MDGEWIVAPATVDDLAGVAAMRDSAAVWQQQQGLVQWDPGEVPEEEFRRQTDSGELFVVRSDQQLVGAVRLVWSDPATWDVDPTHAAGYVHGLMTSRRGTGLGNWLLTWSENHIRDQGRWLSRLDCVVTNDRLRNYYLDHGYHEVGVRTFGDPAWRPVMRFEKPLTQ